MGCIGYIVLGVAVLWLISIFGLKNLIIAFIAGWIVYHIFLS